MSGAEKQFYFPTRDLDLARKQCQGGMHHTYFWICSIFRMFRALDVKSDGHRYDAVTTGQHEMTFEDPATSLKYRLTITPIFPDKKDAH